MVHSFTNFFMLIYSKNKVSISRKDTIMKKILDVYMKK